MRILAIDTSCDETAAAVTENTKILSNIIWSQASLHAKFGGVMPSLAQRMHEERIDFVVKKALGTRNWALDIDCIAVTVGPGLAIALGVGIDRAKKLAKKYHKPLIPVNHVEAHLLSSFAQSKNSEYQVSRPEYPALGLVVSGGNTVLVKINQIGNYEILAETQDDALGEALDKAARILGLGYPGGAILEKIARDGDPKKYKLPIPIIGHEDRKIFTYSGLKTAFYRLVEKENPLTKEKIQNLAACFQDIAFTHVIRILHFCLSHQPSAFSHLLVGGGVSANIELRRRLRKLGKEFGINILFPYTKKLCGDNAAMIGVAAYFKTQRGEFVDPDNIDRNPRLKLNTKHLSSE
jgi:N6-L-threonylcarbamoyladenine synthase